MPHPPEPSSDDLDLPRPAPPRSWRDRVEHLADATGTTPARIVVGGLLLAAAAGVGVWATRPPGDPVEVSLPYASSTTALAAPTSTEPAVIVVHVAGAVARPGVYALAAEARVVDAVSAAGGLAEGADDRRLNLAAPLADGQRVYVPRQGEELPPDAGPESAGGDPGSETGSALIDLNTADASALDALPGVGPATATAIVEHRQRIGRFTSVEQLLDVRGIGEAKLEALRGLVTV